MDQFPPNPLSLLFLLSYITSIPQSRERGLRERKKDLAFVKPLKWISNQWSGFLVMFLYSRGFRVHQSRKLRKLFNPRDYVVREGDKGDGIYFIFEGEAEVGGSFNVEEDNRQELQLKQYDYFSYNTSTSVHQADVIALTKLICLVLPDVYISLLQPKSIWCADETLMARPLLESILQLDPIEVNLFRGFTLPNAPMFAQVFGGQLIGQALAAASKTVDSLKFVHSLHCYFLLAGDLGMPIVYQVQRLRDGKSFATRRVEATQKGNVIFMLLASFQKEEKGFEHQVVTMPSVPSPDMLLNMEQLRERRLIDPLLPREYRNKVASKRFIPWPVEIKFCDPNNNTNHTKASPSLNYWFRARGKLSDDQALHRCVLAYISDLILLQVSLNPHRRKGFKTASLTLDHAMWFHRPVKADDWILYSTESPSASNARGFCIGRMFNMKGELIVSLIQEGVIRNAKPPNQVPKSKL